MRKILTVLIIVTLSATLHSFAQAQEQAGGGNQPNRNEQQGALSSDRRLPFQNSKGHELGQVVALATTDNIVAYFLVAMNGSNGELTPIPFSAALYDPQKHTVMLLADSQLVRAPTIGSDEVQRLADPEFEMQVRSYYGLEPAEEEPVQEEEE